MEREGKGRLDPRVAAKLRVDVEYPPRGDAWTRAESIDLSASGVYVRCGQTLPLKSQVGCRVFLPASGAEEDNLVDTQAVVVRVDLPETGSKEWRYGLYFLNLEERDLEAIRRFVFSSM